MTLKRIPFALSVVVLLAGATRAAIYRMFELARANGVTAFVHSRFMAETELGGSADADLVVFDPQRIADRATFAEPALPSAGIAHVLVNGEFVVRDGELQRGSYPGRPVRRGH